MIRYFILLFSSLVLFSCSGRKTIKDKDLENILCDIFVYNAYVNINKIELDSLNIYRPIFKRYGYDEKDMLNTLTHFSRRKSSRFGDVVDDAIKQMDRRFFAYEYRVAMLDTVLNIANRKYSQLIYSDSLIKLDKPSDMEKLKLKFAAERGRYRIKFGYKFPKMDKNFSVKVDFSVVDSLGENIANKSSWLSTSNIKGATLDIDAPEGADSLVGVLVEFPSTQEFTPFVIDSISVRYFLAEKVALDSLYRSIMTYELLIDSISYDKVTENISSLCADTTGLVIQGDSIN